MVGSQSHVHIEKGTDGISTITIAKEPVNTMDLGLWEDLGRAFDELEQDDEVRAVIFCSGLQKRVFTAGLDIRELHAPSTSEERFLKFWRTLSNGLIKIYRSPMLTAAAV